MKRNITMKKNTFITGAFVTSFGIILSKLLGVIYVIFFHSIVGDLGGALYGYAYTVYNFFISIASLGIPLSISKIVSEYQTLGYYKAKRKAFVLAKRISLLLGFASFLIVLFLAPIFAREVIGNNGDINHIKDVIFVIRIVGISLLIVPVLSIYRGYFEGHRLFVPPSVSQVLEQFFRVLVIIQGSYLTVKIFHLPLSVGVGIALFGTFVGGAISFVYLMFKYFINKKVFKEKVRPVNEVNITNKMILKKIICYSIPFVLIDLFKSLYNVVDMFSVVRGLKEVGYSLKNAEIIYSMMATWANKFTMVLLAVSAGVITSIIPNLTEVIIKNNKKNIEDIISQALNVFLFLSIPITLGISFLAKPIWILFYGNSNYGVSVLSFYIFIGLFIGLFTIFVIIMQTFKDIKGLLISLISGFLIKLIFNSYFLKSFHSIGLPAYYGVIVSSILGYFISIIICIIWLHKKYDVSFQNVFKNLIDILVLSFIMVFVLFIIHLIVPLYSDTRILNLLIIIIYGSIGGGIYLLCSNKITLFSKVFKKELFSFYKSLIGKK